MCSWEAILHCWHSSHAACTCSMSSEAGPFAHHGLQSQVPNHAHACSRTFDDTIAAIQDQAASLQAAQQRLRDQAQAAQEQLQRLHSARTTDLAEVWQQLDGKADMDVVRKATSGLTSGTLVQQVGQGRLGGPL